MCGIEAAIAAASVGTSIYGAAQGASAARQSGAYQMQAAQQTAQQLALEAQIAEANAKMAMIEASGRISQTIGKTEAVIGHNRADAAARGLAVDQGSPLLDEAYVASQGKIDQQLIAAGGLMEKANQYQRAAASSAQANEALGAGEQALVAARYGAGTAWLNGLQSSLRSLGGVKWNTSDAKTSDKKTSASGGGRFSADPSSWWS